MSKHILVAIDLTVESWLLLEKAENLARDLNARLSLFYNGKISSEGDFDTAYDPKFGISRKSSDKSTPEQHLNELLGNTKYPIESTFIGSGNFVEEIERAIKKLDVSLIICGHHQDIRHQFMSVTKRLLKSTSTDLMIIPLK